MDIKRIFLEILTMLCIISLAFVFSQKRASFIPEEHRLFYNIILAGILIVIAGYISLRTAISIAILELAFGGLGRFLNIEPTETLVFLAEIGAIILMFIVGTEIEIDIFKRNFKENIILGTLIFTVPFLLIILTFGLLEKLTLSTILLGVALGATSVAVIYTLLYDMLIVYTPLGHIIFGGTMICDIISVVLGKFTLLSLLYPVILLFLFYFVPKTGKILIKLKSSWEFELKVILLLMFAIVSRVLGIHAVLTAFILGLLISGTARSKRMLREKIRGLGFGFSYQYFSSFPDY